YDLADIGLLPDLQWGSQRTENYNFGISNEFGYSGKCSGYGGPSDYHGYTISAWRIQPDDTLGAPQYHVHEEGPLCKTEMELPPFATGNITHSHDDYTHRHYIPQR
ncbi:MAG: hypothetical protein HQ572_01195, partial [Candidatus Omnitrophica bacterium]|nr:hypothetical protein [Candidatus Omnitrophota bacterium]